MKKYAGPIIAAILLLLLPVLYVGSYLALVMPPGRTGIKTVYEDGKQGTVFYLTNYRFGTSAEQWAFWPVEQIDRKVRPGAWDSLEIETLPFGRTETD